MPEVKFYLKNPKAKIKSSIYLDFPYDGQRLQMPIGLSIHPSKWNKNKGKLKHQYANERWYSNYKLELEKIERLIIQFYEDQKISSIIPSPQSIKNYYQGAFKSNPEKEAQKSFFDIYEKFLTIRANEVSIRTISKYKTLLNLLYEFESSAKFALNFKSIDLSFFDEFKAFLYNKPNKKVPNGVGMLDPSVNKYISVLKTFMTWSYDRGYHTNQSYQKFSVPIKKKEKIITLNIRDIRAIEGLDLSKNERLSKVRDIFLFGFYTLQRWSDIDRFSKDDLFYNDIIGYHFWRFESFKTKEEILVPFVGFSEAAFGILEKNNLQLPLMSHQRFNDYLKELGKLAGLTRILKKKRIQANKQVIIHKKHYEFMSSHIMRRSGITYLLEKGMAPTSILKLTGHEDIATLMRYENTSNEAVAEALKVINIRTDKKSKKKAER